MSKLTLTQQKILNNGLTDNQVIRRAKEILKNRHAKGTHIDSPADMRDYLQLNICELEREVFGVIFLDIKHRIIKDDIMFKGTLDSCSVPIREVAKAALHVNAGNIVVYHNHPTGELAPSISDQKLTKMLREALSLLGIKLLDHFICSTEGAVSLAERGML